jgi:hypothetical protein
MGLILLVDRTCHQVGRKQFTTERSKQALDMEENLLLDLSFLSQLNCLRLQAQRDNRYTRVTFAPQHL